MYIQLSKNIGHSNQNSTNITKDDFYTVCMKNPLNNIGLRKYAPKNKNAVFKTDDVTVDYLCSDFVRFCLALYKNNVQITTGEMSIIPKQPIPISKELQEYIEDYLPDYYDIRTNRK